MHVTYIPGTDTAFVRVSGVGARVAARCSPHPDLILHLQADSTAAGLEFRRASRGVRLTGLPLAGAGRAAAARALRRAGIAVLDYSAGED